MILIRTAAIATAAAMLSASALAQRSTQDAAASYPNRAIRLIVPVPPGGSSDGMARVLGQRLTESWGQQVVVDNRPGAAEIIRTDIVAKEIRTATHSSWCHSALASETQRWATVVKAANIKAE